MCILGGSVVLEPTVAVRPRAKNHAPLFRGSIKSQVVSAPKRQKKRGLPSQKKNEEVCRDSTPLKKRGRAASVVRDLSAAQGGGKKGMHQEKGDKTPKERKSDATRWGWLKGRYDIRSVERPWRWEDAGG